MRLHARTAVVVSVVVASITAVVPRASAAGYTSVAVGNFHTCATTPQGAVYCWGDNGSGQLGEGSYSPSFAATPVPVPSLPAGVSAIAAGSYHTCAALSGGTVRCWGSNGRGQLGDGTYVERTSPVDVSGLSDVVAVSAGAFHTCALTSTGSVRCWGRNDLGQLGDGSSSDSPTPVAVTGLSSGVTAISSGAYHTCALLSGGTVRCWGFNAYGQLGNGSTTTASTPVDVPELTNVSSVSAGGLFTCAVTAAHDVMCWGDNTFGELGTSASSTRTPAPVPGLAGSVSAVAAGAYFACAVEADASIACWGYNDSGDLGDGTLGGSRSTPTVVAGLAGVARAGAGVNDVCAVANGGLWCWGNNDYGQLGDGTTNTMGRPVLAPFPDSTPPSVSVTGTSCSSPGNDGWCLGFVEVTFGAIDAGSGVASPCTGASCSFTRSTTTNGSSVSVEPGTVCDAADNCTTGAAATGLKIDTVAPAIVCPTVPTFVLGDAATLTATVDDATSGPVAATLSASADTSGVGTHSLSFATSDIAGNMSTVACAYKVVYRFTGFFSPQSNTALNDQKAGGSTSVKFSLSGNK
ncbi:MAG: RCC1 domain-containing protein, partial [Actinomycetota bacterium]